jgi:hypothetical protein
VRPIYRFYPAYAKGREPAGYLESLKQKDPEIVFDPSKLYTKEDWVAAGKLIFETDTQFFPAPEQLAEGDFPFPVSKDGMLYPAVRYYIRANCHMPPLYTNNKITPVIGFKIPDDLCKTDDILDFSVGTDPYLALKTRRGTGFYKVPSLKGVWFRNAFGHTGQAETLEEWLDPARLRADYVPKGFHIGPGSIRGHSFGLDLSATEKQDLIVFLKTL